MYNKWGTVLPITVIGVIPHLLTMCRKERDTIKMSLIIVAKLMSYSFRSLFICSACFNPYCSPYIFKMAL